VVLLVTARLLSLLDALEDAACRSAPLGVFFPEPRVSAEAVDDALRRYCDRCPVRRSCWQYAELLESDGPLDRLYGIVAGLGPEERMAVYRARRGSSQRQGALVHSD